MNLATLNSITLNNTLLSRTLGDPFLGLITDPSKPREFVLRADPKNTSGAPVNVDFSTSGYLSRSSDVPYQLFPPGIQIPSTFTVSLDDSLAGATNTGYGMSSIANGDGAYDSFAKLDWLGATSELYMGPPEPAPFAQFTKVLKGTTAGVTRTLDSISTVHRDMRWKLKTRLQKHTYRGTGAAIRGNGTSSVGTATVTCPAGSMTFECLFRPLTSNTSLRYIMAYQSGAGGRLFRFTTGATNRLEWRVVGDALQQFAIIYDNFPTLGNLKRITAVLDTINLQLRLYVDGVEVATPVAITGTYNTVLNAFAILRRPDSATLYMDGDIDDVRIYNYARTQAETQREMDIELTGAETGLIAYWKLNEGSGGSALNSVPAGATMTLTNTTWVGSMEGDSSLAGTVKPIAVGKRRQIEPKWVDTQRLVLQFNDGSMEGVDALRDSGDLLTFGADVSDIYGSTPSAGTWNSCKVMGLVRLGSTPVGTITGDIRGINGGLVGYADSAATINQKLLVDIAGVDPVNEIDLFAHSNLDALNSAEIGHYFDEPINIDDAQSEVLKSIRAWGGPTRVGVQTVGRIDDPRNLTPTVFWTLHDINIAGGGDPYIGEPFGVRVSEVVIGYRPYHTILTPDRIAAIVTLANRVDFGQEYRYVRSPVAGAPEDAKPLIILTGMDSAADAKLEANRLAAFLGRGLDQIRLQVGSGSLSHFIGTVVSLTIEQTNANGDTIVRYEEDEKLYIVIAIDEKLGHGGSYLSDTFSVRMVG